MSATDPSLDTCRPTSGAWIVGGMLALGAALAVFAVSYQWGQTRRCLAFYGSEAAHRIQVASRVELWRLDPGGAAVRPESGDRRRDVSLARGLVHLRRGLVEDANFTWKKPPSANQPGAAVALAFFDSIDDADPATVVVVHLDEPGGRLEVAGRPGTLALGRIAAGLRKWLADIDRQPPEGPGQPENSGSGGKFGLWAAGSRSLPSAPRRGSVSMRSIAVANQKGGVGKTTTSVNLACALARSGRTVCLVDLDPQAHATLHAGVQPAAGAVSAFDVLTADRPLEAALVRAGERLWVVPGHIDLSAVDMALAAKPGRETILRRRIAADDRCGGHASDGVAFDYMIVDCPPSLGLLSLNALAAVNEVLLPLQPHFLALHGLSKLLETVELVADHVHSDLRLLGVVLCLYESGTRLATEIGRDVEAFFRGAEQSHRAWRDARLFATRIRRNVRLAEAPSFGRSVFDYAPESHGAADYAALAAEVDQASAAGRDRRAA